MKIRPTKLTAGFSLVELMAVVAIISILVSTSITQYRMMYVKAYRVEATTNMRIIKILQESYRTQNGRYFSPGVYFGLTAMTPANFVIGSTSSLTKSTPCAKANPLGFSVRGCDKLRYGYASAADAMSPTRAFAIHAMEFGDTSTRQRTIYQGCARDLEAIVYQYDELTGQNTEWIESDPSKPYSGSGGTLPACF